MLVQDIITTTADGLITVEPEMKLLEAAHTMSRARISALVVTAPDNTLQGILSERDIVHAVTEHDGDISGVTVGQVMTREVFTCSLTDELNDIMHDMVVGWFRHMPVLDNGKLAGIISIRDVVVSRLNEVQAEEGRQRADNASML